MVQVILVQLLVKLATTSFCQSVCFDFWITVGHVCFIFVAVFPFCKTSVSWHECIYEKSNKKNKVHTLNQSETVTSSDRKSRGVAGWLGPAWYGSTVIRPVYSPSNFGKSLRQSWIILCSPLPPSCHNHTCLILSNLSFVLATQLQRCTLLHHWLSSDSIIFSLIRRPLLLFPPRWPSFFFSIFILSCLLPHPRPLPLLPWHQGQPWPIQAPGLKQIRLGLYSSTRIKNS